MAKTPVLKPVEIGPTIDDLRAAWTDHFVKYTTMRTLLRRIYEKPDTAERLKPMIEEVL